MVARRRMARALCAALTATIVTAAFVRAHFEVEYSGGSGITLRYEYGALGGKQEENGATLCVYSYRERLDDDRNEAKSARTSGLHLIADIVEEDAARVLRVLHAGIVFTCLLAAGGAAAVWLTVRLPSSPRLPFLVVGLTSAVLVLAEIYLSGEVHDMVINSVAAKDPATTSAARILMTSWASLVVVALVAAIAPQDR